MSQGWTPERDYAIAREIADAIADAIVLSDRLMAWRQAAGWSEGLAVSASRRFGKSKTLLLAIEARSVAAVCAFLRWGNQP